MKTDAYANINEYSDRAIKKCNSVPFVFTVDCNKVKVFQNRCDLRLANA